MQNLDERIKKLNVNYYALKTYYSLITGCNLYELGKTGVSKIDEPLGLTGNVSQNKYVLDAIVATSSKEVTSRPLLTEEALNLCKRLQPSKSYHIASLEDSIKFIAEDADVIEDSHIGSKFYEELDSKKKYEEKEEKKEETKKE